MVTHRCEARVRYADTDRGGVVYYANYLAFFEVGRTEMMRACGVTYRGLEDRGYIMPVVEAHVSYHAPASYDDLLVIESEVTEVKRVRMRVDTTVSLADDGRVLARGWVWLACTEGGTKVVPIPEEVRNALA